MAYRNLQEFIAALTAAGELRRIAAEVDPVLEITEIIDRVSKANGPALLFERVAGSSFPVLANAFGSSARLAMALGGRSFEDIAGRIETYLKFQPGKGLAGKVKALLTLKEIADFMPKTVKRAPCQETVYPAEGSLLDLLPILTCWPNDAGPFLTLPLVITKDPDTGVQNMGMYRMQKYNG